MTYEPNRHPGCLGCASREATITDLSVQLAEAKRMFVERLEIDATEILNLRAKLAECKRLLTAEIARHDALSDDVFNACKSDERVLELYNLELYNKEWARHLAECKAAMKEVGK